jgi:hypothetical protein
MKGDIIIVVVQIVGYIFLYLYQKRKIEALESIINTQTNGIKDLKTNIDAQKTVSDQMKDFMSVLQAGRLDDIAIAKQHTEWAIEKAKENHERRESELNGIIQNRQEEFEKLKSSYERQLEEIKGEDNAEELVAQLEQAYQEKVAAIEKQVADDKELYELGSAKIQLEQVALYDITSSAWQENFQPIYSEIAQFVHEEIKFLPWTVDTDGRVRQFEWYAHMRPNAISKIKQNRPDLFSYYGYNNILILLDYAWEWQMRMFDKHHHREEVKPNIISNPRGR